MTTLSPRQRNKELNRLVRNFLLEKRTTLARKLNDNRFNIRKLSKEQKELKTLLTEVNREIDHLGIRIKDE